MSFQNRWRTFLKSFFMVVFFLLGIMTSPLLAVEPKEILSLSLEAQFQLDFEGIKKTQIYI
ncbi:hypothetical protein KAV79_05270, partial [Candidatus Aerophobetes bacterium]|nr:hypothetical protein [Candidatus Aerophobetes bacterium]